MAFEAYGVVIATLFGVLWLFSVLQIARICYYGHRLTSFQFGFLLLCCGWSFLRMFLFGLPVELSEMALLYIYWLPTDFQFATFTLVLVYDAFIVYESNWREKKTRVFIVYVVNNLFLVLTTVGVGIAFCVYPYDCETGGPERTDVASAMEELFHTILGIEYLALSVVHAYYSRQLWGHARAEGSGFQQAEEGRKLTLTFTDSLPVTPAQDAPRADAPLANRRSDHSSVPPEYSPFDKNIESNLAGLGRSSSMLQRRPMLILTLLVYVSRCIYYFLSAFNLWNLEIIQDEHTFMKSMSFTVWLLFVVWEVLPTCMVLYAFRYIQPTNLRCPMCCRQRSPTLLTGVGVRQGSLSPVRRIGSLESQNQTGSPDSNYHNLSDNEDPGRMQIPYINNSPIATSVLQTWKEQKSKSRSALRAKFNETQGMSQSHAIPPSRHYQHMSSSEPAFTRMKQDSFDRGGTLLRPAGGPQPKPPPSYLALQ